jgi:hypothetical protein
MHWHDILAASIGIIITALWVWLIVAWALAHRRIQRKYWEDYDKLTRAFNALPAPKNPIPTTIRKRTK